jgi:hypothetical protein
MQRRWLFLFAVCPASRVSNIKAARKESKPTIHCWVTVPGYHSREVSVPKGQEKVAQQFIAGKRRKDGAVPIGTIESDRRTNRRFTPHAFYRPCRDGIFIDTSPGPESFRGWATFICPPDRLTSGSTNTHRINPIDSELLTMTVNRTWKVRRHRIDSLFHSPVVGRHASFMLTSSESFRG